MLSVMLSILVSARAVRLAREREFRSCTLLDASEHNALGTVHGAEANYSSRSPSVPRPTCAWLGASQ